MEPIREQQIDLRSYLRILTKRKWVIITVFTLVIVIMTIHTFSQVPVYMATTQIVIEKDNPNLVSIEEVMAVDTASTDYYQTQYQIIKSRSVAREVIRRLDLRHSEEFFPPPRTDVISQTRQWVSGTVATIKKQIKGLLNTGGSESKKSTSKDEVSADESADSLDSDLVSMLISRIHVNPVSNSRLVNVGVEAKDPVLAARMANEVVRAYMDQNLATKLSAAKDAVKWLTERIEEERKKVEDAENSLLKYKEQNEIITDFSSDSENITAEKLARLNAQVIEAESQRVEAETRYKQALAVENKPEMLDTIPEVLNNELVKEIKKREMALHNKMSELSKKYGPRHPQMMAIQSELEDLRKRKITEARRVVDSLRNQYKLAVARENSLKEALEKQKAESLEMNKKAIRYGVLQRQAESSRHMYELLIKRFKETSLTEEMKTGNIRVIDEAEVPTVPIRPDKKRNLMLAMVIGLSLGIGLAFLLEFLDNTVKLPDDVKDYLKIPYLGPIPAFDTAERMDGLMGDLITEHSPKSTSSESFRGVRTAVLFSSPERVPKVILVTSAEPAEGKTLCAGNIAVTMAQAGARTIILDCDMRRPKIHNLFGLKRNKGVANVLVGTETTKDVIQKTKVANLDMIACGPIPPNPSEILGSPRMASMLEELKTTYDRIIIDSPPVTAVTDSVVLAQSVDGVLLVIRAGITAKQAILNAVNQLKGVNVRIIGGVLNAVNTSRDSYYYQYYYYYYGSDHRKKKQGSRKKLSTPSEIPN